MPRLAGEATYIGPEWLCLVSKIGIIVRLLLLIIKSYIICFFGFFVFVLVVVYLDFFFARLGTATGSISGNRDLIVIFKCSQKCDSLCNSKHGVSLVK